MAVRWRELLSHLQIPWVERSPNISRGEIGIKCPWCGPADPSEHLAIDEATGFYKCRRSSGHGGRKPYYFLHALGVGYAEMDTLLERYGGAPAVPRDAPAQPRVPPTQYAKQWALFRPAASDTEACAYLAKRGFWNPARTARAFDLRVGEGRYAGRLWFPFLHGKGVAGYTGRAMRARGPRYMTEALGALLYMPRLPFDSDKVIVLVEGPIDALRLADAALDRYNLFVAALCGLSMSPDKRLQLAALARLLPRLFVVLDSTVSPVNVNRLRRELNACLSGDGKAWDRVRRLDLPPGVDDPGAMTGEQTEQWLMQTGLARLAAM
jgi:hypothetical protein